MFLFLVSNLTFWDFSTFFLFRTQTTIHTLLSKTASLSHVSNKVLRAKWPHKPGVNIMFSVKTHLYNWICHQNLDFQNDPPAPLRFLCLINSFYRRYVCCIPNRSNRFSRSNRSNRSKEAGGTTGREPGEPGCLGSFAWVLRYWVRTLLGKPS